MTVVWSLLSFRGLYRAMRDHPHTLEGDKAVLRFSFRRRCEVALASVATMKISRSVSRDAFRSYAPWERFCVNHCDLVELTLSREATVEERTGERRPVVRLAVSFDDADGFVRAVERRRNG